MKILGVMNIKKQHLPTLLTIVIIVSIVMYFINKINTL
jgi:hypothetical protein